MTGEELILLTYPNIRNRPGNPAFDRALAQVRDTAALTGEPPARVAIRLGRQLNASEAD